MYGDRCSTVGGFAYRLDAGAEGGGDVRCVGW